MRKNKIAVVTGAARGIGNEIAKTLVEDGFYVILSDVANVENVNLQRFESKCEYIKCDISSQDDRDNLFVEIERRHGRLDLLVNNAGVAPKQRMDILDTTAENFNRVIDINLRSTFFMCQKCANYMIDKTGKIENYNPRIINISSISAYTSSTARGEYCISKAGVSMITQLFADRLSEFEIPVFEVRPGIILTDMTAVVKEKYDKMIAEGVTPIKRFGQPKDVANCVSALVSGKLDFATGQVINADGGFHIRRL